MSRLGDVTRRRLWLITGAMVLAALATGIGLLQGYDSIWSVGAFLAFLLVAAMSGYELSR
ncbi:hypothetical protein [Halococcus sp. IIIV-5B]|uniref:hypothetical protein n=1 Tax=Halococcus sp. IIIV-5B TaxID=2321230 RepID=UPI000E74FB39|nr:hypothetical protein [Halococcus sp. IIIV-5B]RJT07446.1 hypothetical protein D3261_02205 [Halococcus sp. IIIV-5B]